MLTSRCPVTIYTQDKGDKGFIDKIGVTKGRNVK